MPALGSFSIPALVHPVAARIILWVCFSSELDFRLCDALYCPFLKMQ